MTAPLEVTRDDEKHTGHACYRAHADGRVTVLCPYGHLVSSVAPGQWGGSVWHARSSFGDDVVTCHGRLAPSAKPYPFKDTALGAWAAARKVVA